MKRCPTCNSTFDEDHLIYCTADGTVLVRDEVTASFELQETALLSDPLATVVMPLPRPTELAQAPNAPTPPQPYGWANESPPAWVPPRPPVPFGGVTRPSQNGTAVASLICGIVSITFGWICGGPIFAVLAVVLAAVALMQIKKNPQQHSGKPIALAGLILGGIVLLIYLAFIALWIVMMIIGAASR